MEICIEMNGGLKEIKFYFIIYFKVKGNIWFYD